MNGLKTERYSGGIRLLDALSPPDVAQLAQDVDIVTLTAHQFTHSVGGVMDHVDFPIDAVLSVVATLENGDSVEVGTVGSESFVESDAALDSSLSSRTSFCQVAGSVGRMSIERFEQRMATSTTFARAMRHNVRAALFSTQQFTACNLKHSVLQRCARWLAMTADRVGGPQFVLTHDFLAIMLGVRRAGVSVAAAALQHQGSIRYTRGGFCVIERHGFYYSGCEC